MSQYAAPVIGAAIGGYFGGSTGAKWGWMIGSTLGAVFAPAQKTQGPRLTDMKVMGTEYGAPIPFIIGTVRTAGFLAWSSKRREIATVTEVGKGPSQEQTDYTYEADCLFVLASNPTAGLVRVWDNGKLIYSMDNDADVDTLLASDQTANWRRITFYGGGDAQLPDPVYEAAVGPGNAPAYRSMTTVFIEGLQLGNSGQFRNLTFEIGTSLGDDEQQDYRDHGPNRYVTDADYPGSSASIGFEGCIEGEGRFGGAAGKFSGNIITPRKGLQIGADYTSVPFARGDWTLRAWLKSPGVSYSSDRGVVFANGLSVGLERGVRVAFNELGQLAIDIRNHIVGDESISVSLTSADEIYPLGAYFHLEVVRWTDYLIAFINGQVVIQELIPAWKRMLNGEPLELCGSRGGQGNWHGYMDDFELASTARHYVSFQPPSQPLQPDSFTQVLVPFYAFPTITRGTETIRTTVERLLERAELPADAYDVTDLSVITRPMRALAVSQVGGTRAALETLVQTFHFNLICTDKVRAAPRAQLPAATIPYGDLGTGTGVESGPPALEITLRGDLETPAQEALTYSNYLDDYQSDTQFSDRVLSDQKSVTSTSVPMVFIPSEAKAVTDARIVDAVIGRWVSSLALPRKYEKLTPGDSVIIEGRDGSTYRMLLGRLTASADGVRAFESKLEEPSAFTQAGVTGDNYPGQTVVQAPAVTLLRMLDIPQLRDADEGPGLYSAAKGLNTPWPGAHVMESTDDLSYQRRATITESAVFGLVLTPLVDWTGQNVFDEQSRLVVNVGEATLSSASRDDVLGNRDTNVILCGDEVLQYCTATLVSAGVYELSRFLRGRLGTDRAMTGHIAGERFVLLQARGIRRVDQTAVDLGALRYFRGVTIGRPVSTANPQEVINLGVSSTPLSPVNVRANRATTDTGITWQRRTRRQTRFLGPLSSSVPLGEATEAYEVDIFTSSAFTTVKRTLTASTPSVTYTSAQQIADFGSNQTVLYVRVYQMSEIVGRGFPRQATI